MANPAAPFRFELLDAIGNGATTVVYRARDSVVDRDVAVKVLRQEFVRDPLFETQFLYAALLFARLAHPGIPPAHELGQLPDGRPFVGMRLIKGQTVEDLLRAMGPLVGHGLELFVSVCRAVGFAHACGIVHRNLSPARVMVGAFGEVQVTGWDLATVTAREVSDAPDARNADRLYSLHGLQFGDLAYMAPEQAAGAVAKIDPRTDVFGLGAILCALLTGYPPYVGDTAEGVRLLAARAELKDCFARLDASRADSRAVALCKLCLCADPLARPVDGCAVAAELASIC